MTEEPEVEGSSGTVKNCGFWGIRRDPAGTDGLVHISQLDDQR
jgi:hypothetical protein